MRYMAKVAGHNLDSYWEFTASNDSDAIRICEEKLYDFYDTNIQLDIYESTDYLIPTANRHIYSKFW